VIQSRDICGVILVFILCSNWLLFYISLASTVSSIIAQCSWYNGSSIKTFRHFGFLAPKDFQIIWLSNILALSVPDECYSRSA
jgi:hypothetical protein